MSSLKPVNLDVPRSLSWSPVIQLSLQGCEYKWSSLVLDRVDVRLNGTTWTHGKAQLGYFRIWNARNVHAFARDPISDSQTACQ